MRLSRSLLLISLSSLGFAACDASNSLFKGNADTGAAGGGAGGGDSDASGGATGGSTGGTVGGEEPPVGGTTGGTTGGAETEDAGTGGGTPRLDGQVGPGKDANELPDGAAPGGAVVPIDTGVVEVDAVPVVLPDGGEPPFPDMFIPPEADAFVPPEADAFVPPEADMAIAPPECLPGELRFCAVPTCLGGQQTCDANGQFGPCVGPAEVCDGQDNDCDGVQDEDFPELGGVCVVGSGACAATGTYICGAGGAGAQCNAQAGPPGFELCDGVDNDCNGAVDDDFDGAPLSVDCYDGPEGTQDVGTCEAGVRVCDQGAYGACLGEILPAIEACNAADDDCNGAADDGPGGAQLSEACYEGPAGTAGVGQCREGVSVCIAGSPAACQNQTVPSVEICDLEDNDCNGVVDDVAGGLSCLCEPGQSRACYTGPANTNGVGSCTGGIQSCTAQGFYGACEGETVPANEACDNIDNDCNGTVDDALRGVGVPCTAGLGECVRDGQTLCDSNAGAIICDAVPADPLPESCDGRDNNCDGQVDEDQGLGIDCSVGIGACTNRGVTVCGANGNVVCSARAGDPVAELCDGQDNDCNGAADDGLNLGEACTVGQGVCAATGVLQCSLDGSVQCSAAPGQATPEACDGLDNDCDGAVDNGNPGGGQRCDTGQAGVCSDGARACVNGAFVCNSLVVPSGERCDGLDNDCDGLRDEDDAGDPLTRLCYEGPAGTSGVGLCHAGAQTCDAGLFGACVGQVLPTAEICDAADNNCNGQSDEDLGATCVCAPNTTRNCYTGPAGTEGVGACRAGTQACAADGTGYGACGGEVFPGGETCNNLDDNCNGTIDDAPGVGLVCGAGAGACFREGHLVCNGDRGLLECDALAGQVLVEICDGTDNDCDGNVDNVPGLGAACSVGVGSCARAGNNVCDVNARALACNVQAGQPADELCDGADNDCDGAVDDAIPGVGGACNEGVGACLASGQTVCLGARGLDCSANPSNPRPETCDGVDNDCNGSVDNNPSDIGQECTAGIGVCQGRGRFVCTNGARTCNAPVGQPSFEVCDQRDNDCDGQTDEGFTCRVFTSCQNAYNAGARENGIYRMGFNNQVFVEVYCDMVTDGGGWTLVGSTREQTLNDQTSNYYNDLRTLAPAGRHDGIWFGMRLENRQNHDVRFACRASIGAQNAPMDVDLSFYSVIWYNEWTRGNDAASCFSENDGQGFDQPAAARRNNLTAAFLPLGSPWAGTDDGEATNYLEGEDRCDDTSDFSVDFRDRGMDSNEVDGSDWGEDDQLRKCGVRNDGDGQWFVFARESVQFRAAERAPSFLVGAGPAFDGPNVAAASCVEVCAGLNGGNAADYICSSQANVVDRQAWLDGFDDPRYCQTPAADTFKVGGPYNCGVAGCSYSAYVRNHDACLQRRNYCYRRVGAAN